MRTFGLIGYPLGHSFSKKYFTEKFEQEGLADCRFELFPLQHIDQYPALLQREPSLKGLAVTIPHKQSVMPYLASIDEAARKIGAVNCIKINNGTCIGYNTDVIGFERSFSPLLEYNHTKALVLGTGGASKAVQFVLNKMGMSFLLVSRNPGEGNGYIGYKDITKDTLDEYTVIINCSPAGMIPHEDTEPDLPYFFISKKHLLYDLVYKPAQTRFLEHGFRQGAIIKNGYEMLIIQAEENWTIWNS
ncbi:MAG TPA: shikimate dehydrogenase [Ferruginibacter sp.]|nr:shikimate dehydrogenase [Ferruginibacter sp.]